MDTFLTDLFRTGTLRTGTFLEDTVPTDTLANGNALNGHVNVCGIHFFCVCFVIQVEGRGQEEVPR